jgi:hypothetical protein
MIRRLQTWVLSSKRPTVMISGVAVAIGLLPMPYGYYMLLRTFFSVLSVYYLTSVRARDWEKWLLAGLAILHNPIAPVELGSKPLWSLINIATVIYFWALSRRPTTSSHWRY